MKNNLVQIKKVNWKKVGKWSPPFLLEWLKLEGTTKEVFAKLGFPLFFQAIMTLGGTTYVNNEIYDQYTAFYKDKIKQKGLKYFTDYNALIYRIGNRQIRFNEQIIKYNDSYINKNFIQIFNKFCDLTKPAMALAYNIQMVDRVLTEQLLNKIFAFLGSDDLEEANKLLSILTYPKPESFIAREKADLFAIALKLSKKLKGKQNKSNLVNKIKTASPEYYHTIKNHQKKYGWMNSIAWNEGEHDFDYYKDRILELINKGEKYIINETKQGSFNQAKANNLIDKFQRKNINIKAEAKTIQESINSKMFNWDAISISGRGLKKILAVIKSYGLNEYQLLYVSPKDIHLLSRKKKIDVEKIKKRIKGFGLARIENNIFEIDSPNVKKITKYLDQLQDSSEFKTIKGQIAYPGRVTGKACIVPTIKDAPKMERDAILVCPMTNPDYIPLIEKSAGIITDEGGILCHAAIVSREYRKPCIIGTKNSTRILYDGDTIELNADKGTIKIIKRATS